MKCFIITTTSISKVVKNISNAINKDTLRHKNKSMSFLLTYKNYHTNHERELIIELFLIIIYLNE